LEEAFVLIKTESGRSKEVLDALNRIDEVVKACVVTGAYDIIAIVRARDAYLLVKNILLDKIHKIPGIISTSTAFAFEP